MSDQSTESAENTEIQETTGFAAGDLGRVQALLFGDQARQSRERVDTLEQALLGAISDLRDEMRSQFGELEKRITNESENRSTALANLTSRVREDVKTLTKTDRGLERDLTKTSEKLHAAIDRTAAESRTSIDAARHDLSEEIQRTNTNLRDSNVDRSALAGMMAAVAEQLADENKPS